MRTPTIRRLSLACALAVVVGTFPTVAAGAPPAAPSAFGTASSARPAAQLARVTAAQSVVLGSRPVTGVVAAGTATSAANSRIYQVLRKRSSSKVLGKRFTMTVWDPASGSYVYQRRAAASLRGASTTKVLTAVAALATLGPEHRFPTTVRAGATPGEVILVAGGDPLLTSADLRALARSTATSLASAANPTTSTATAAPVPSGAATPGPAATITPDTGTPGAATTDPTAATPAPEATFAPPAPVPTTPASTTPLPIPVPIPEPTTPEPTTPAPATPVPAATPVGPITVRADDSLFSGSGQSHGWRNSYLPREVRPVGAFARDDRKVRDATKDAGSYFAAALRGLGISAKYAGEATAAPESATLAGIPGHSLAEALSRMLLISDNDTAEMLFRHVAVGRGLPATWAGARQGVADTLGQLQVPLTGVRIVDGSGLSLDGRLTAGALTSALALAISPAHPELSGLRAWLPVAGRTGTLKASNRRFSSRPSRCAAGRIQAKTGTVADAIALAGYASGADGQTKVFVSIVNSRPTRYSRVATRAAVDRAASSVTGCW